VFLVCGSLTLLLSIVGWLRRRAVGRSIGDACSHAG
jgi:hypothetical protein